MGWTGVDTLTPLLYRGVPEHWWCYGDNGSRSDIKLAVFLYTDSKVAVYWLAGIWNSNFRLTQPRTGSFKRKIHFFWAGTHLHPLRRGFWRLNSVYYPSPYLDLATFPVPFLLHGSYVQAQHGSSTTSHRCSVIFIGYGCHGGSSSSSLWSSSTACMVWLRHRPTLHVNCAVWLTLTFDGDFVLRQRWS